MIPVAICMHYHPDIDHGCIAGRCAPAECHCCMAYLEGEDFIGPTAVDAKRVQSWRDARGPIEPKLPRAHFRGVGPTAPWPR